MPLRLYLIAGAFMALAAFAGVQTLRVAHLQRDAAQVQAALSDAYAASLRAGWHAEQARNRAAEQIADTTRADAEARQLDTQRSTAQAVATVREVVRTIEVTTEGRATIPAGLVFAAQSVVDRANAARGRKPEALRNAPVRPVVPADGRVRLASADHPEPGDAGTAARGLRTGYDGRRAELPAVVRFDPQREGSPRCIDRVGHRAGWAAGRGARAAIAGARVHRAVEGGGRDPVIG